VLATREPLFWGSFGRRAVRLDRRGVLCGLLNGGLYALAAWRWGAGVEFVAFAALLSTLLVVSVIDVEHSRIPDRITFPAMGAAALVIAVASLVTVEWRRVLAALVGAGLFWGALGVAHLLHPRGMGRGDVKLAVTLGLSLGWVAKAPADAIVLVLAAFFWASVVGTVVGVVLLVRRRRSAPYPFGPALVAGSVAVLLLSSPLAGG
jgi:leader peptidase (prepilin peptidase)/N-methyltransferase